ncbi:MULTISPECIES: hypothetical protein [unclassified Microcoleus]|uniref:hypothetical protein n=1 Tax=unclassified Microcoleus TaxID=2642155 RepID=UPI002FCFA21F
MILDFRLAIGNWELGIGNWQNLPTSLGLKSVTSVTSVTKSTAELPTSLGLKSVTSHILHHSRLTGWTACSTKNEFSCGTGILPVPKQVIENGARCQLHLTSCSNVNWGFWVGWGRVF